MVNGNVHPVLRHIRRVAVLGATVDRTDGDLLRSFVARRDEAAFEALVVRHGPMVHSVCRRVLHGPHDADDAFQAVFLVLVRRAGAIAPGIAGQLAARRRPPRLVEGPRGPGQPPQA